MNKQPLVSVIIPYNKDRGYLTQAIRSVKNQSYKNVELILSQSDRSVGCNMNRGIEKSKGDLICYLAEDDLLPKRSIESRVDYFLEYPNTDFVHGRGWKMFKDGSKTEYKLNDSRTTFKSCLENNGIMGGTTMYRKELFQKFKFDEELWTAEEWDFHLRLLKSKKKLSFVNDFCYIYRRHYEQKSIGNLSNEYQNKRNIVKDEIRKRYI